VSLPRIILRGVPERGAGIHYLREYLPELELCMDRTRNAMTTFLAAMAMAGPDAALHMEDDAVLAAGFHETVGAAVRDRPDAVIQFFSRRGADLVLGSRWDSTFSCSVCFYAPPGYSAGILAFAPGWMQQHPEHPTGFDLVVNDYLRLRRERHWIHVPNAVDHRAGRSAIDGRRSSRRFSRTFPGQ